MAVKSGRMATGSSGSLLPKQLWHFAPWRAAREKPSRPQTPTPAKATPLMTIATKDVVDLASDGPSSGGSSGGAAGDGLGGGSMVEDDVCTEGDGEG